LKEKIYVRLELTFTTVRRDRSRVARTLNATPLFSRDISCLALIMGETSGSERGLGFVLSTIIPTHPAIPERFTGEIQMMHQIRDQG